MTDVKRMRHLFTLLMETQEQTGTDKLWDVFKETYHPTEKEIIKLQALYKAYNENEGVNYGC